MLDAEFGLELAGQLCEFALDVVVSAMLETGSADPKQPNRTNGLVPLSLNDPKTLPIPSALIDHEDIPNGRNGICR
jgi:hypothetical protein